jgi:threonine synthase
MAESGAFDRGDTVVCYVTGNGLKAVEPLMKVLPKPQAVEADLAKVSAVIK